MPCIVPGLSRFYQKRKHGEAPHEHDQDDGALLQGHVWLPSSDPLGRIALTACSILRKAMRNRATRCTVEDVEGRNRPRSQKDARR